MDPGKGERYFQHNWIALRLLSKQRVQCNQVCSEDFIRWRWFLRSDFSSTRFSFSRRFSLGLKAYTNCSNCVAFLIPNLALSSWVAIAGAFNGNTEWTANGVVRTRRYGKKHKHGKNYLFSAFELSCLPFEFAVRFYSAPKFNIFQYSSLRPILDRFLFTCEHGCELTRNDQMHWEMFLAVNPLADRLIPPRSNLLAIPWWLKEKMGESKSILCEKVSIT